MGVTGRIGQSGEEEEAIIRPTTFERRLKDFTRRRYQVRNEVKVQSTARARLSLLKLLHTCYLISSTVGNLLWVPYVRETGTREVRCARATSKV